MADTAAFADSLARKPALFHFKRKPNRLACAMTLFAVRLHIGDVGDRPVVAQKGYAQR